MCIIIHNKHNRLSKNLLRECWRSNNDGAGIMYVRDKKIKVFKTLDNFGAYYKEYSSLRKDSAIKDIILHFRIGTAGLINIDNVHPFKVNKNLYFAHNGIIDIPIEKHSLISDTVVFNEKILKQLPYNFHKNSAIIELISKFVKGNKLIFLDNNNNVVIVNSHLGHIDKHDNWFSNYSYSCTYGFSTKAYSKKSKKKNKTFDDYESYNLNNYYAERDNYINDINKPLNDDCLICGDVLLSIKELNKQVCTNCLNSSNLSEKELIQLLRLSQ